MESNLWFVKFDEEADGIEWEFDDAVDLLHVVTEDTPCDLAWCDWIIFHCKAEIERRKGLLDELTQEAQDLKIGY